MSPLRDGPPHALLGVPPNASSEEIRQALDRLARVLAPGSLALYSALGREQQRELHESLGIAGALLLARHPPGEPSPHEAGVEREPQAPPPLRLAAPPPEPPSPAPDLPDSESAPIGARLRAAREAASLTLRDVAQRTRIPLAHLAAIEEQAFDRLPLRAYLRGFVMTYGQLLKLDPGATWDAYRDAWEAAGFGRDGGPVQG